jgi:phosphatidylglycerophosphatase A
VIKDRISTWFATCSYLGYLPFAPGTGGSLLACIVVYLFPLFLNPLVIVLMMMAAVVTSERVRGDKIDPSHIVIDEFVGVLVTMMGHKLTILALLEGFILFRVFDILKPYPIRRLERLHGGFGIVADDVLAGIYASAVLFLVGWFSR